MDDWSARPYVGRAWRETALLVVAVLGFYVAACYPALQRHNFDFSRFIFVGSRFADAAQTAPGIYIYTPSSGYDGEFYYRMSVDPWSTATHVAGVQFDNAAYRMQRIFYPLVVKALSFGNVEWTPLVMILVNLLGLVIIAIAASRLTRRLSCPSWTPFAILMWPGFIITVFHDTTEIVSAATILVALESYLSGRIVLFALLGCAAVLSRETNLIAFAGLGLFEIWWSLSKRDIRFGRYLGLALIAATFLLWRIYITRLWGASPSDGVSINMDWPLFGLTKMFVEIFDGTRKYVGRIYKWQEVVGIALIVVYSVIGVVRSLRMLRSVENPSSPLALAWLPMLAILTVLSAGGPLIDATAYFRAFTEWYVIGIFLVAPALRRWTFGVPNLALIVGLWVIAAKLADLQVE